MEPAHNHMGKLLPIPYDRLVVGAYTTAQFHGENPDSSAILFNDEILENGQRAGLTAQLTKDHLGDAFRQLPFSAVPDAAPELHKALEFFYHELEHYGEELANAWGAIIITENQDGLKRIDVIISWDEVQLSPTGAVIKGEDGNPIVVLDENGVPVRRWSADHIFIHKNSAYFEN
jgi:hypothetical protein